MSGSAGQRISSEVVSSDPGRVHALFLCTRRSVERWGDDRQMLSVTLRDGGTVLQGRTSKRVQQHLRSFEPGEVVVVMGRRPRRLGSRYVLIDSIVRTDAPPEPFLPRATRDVDELWGFLEHWISEVGDVHYRRLLEIVFAEDCLGSAVRVAPLTLLGPYAYRGGLLEHVVAVSTLAGELCDVHRGLDRDLLLTAVLVHGLDVAGWGAREVALNVRRERLGALLSAAARRLRLPSGHHSVLRQCAGIERPSATGGIELTRQLVELMTRLDVTVGAAKLGQPGASARNRDLGPVRGPRSMAA